MSDAFFREPDAASHKPTPKVTDPKTSATLQMSDASTEQDSYSSHGILPNFSCALRFK
jgi:hypothetical protein